MKWEYKIIEVSRDQLLTLRPGMPTLETKINQFGAEGWELVSVFDGSWKAGPQLGSIETAHMVFKRSVSRS
jgi:hypothetical protein